MALATLGTQDIGRRQTNKQTKSKTKQKTHNATKKTKKMSNTTKKPELNTSVLER
jgi:hypothetical protein